MFLKKQDRQGVRTAAELDRRYNVKKVEGVANDSLKVASEASATAEESRQAASMASQGVEEAKAEAAEAKEGLNGKVGNTEYDTVVDMINKSTAIVKLLANRLVIESKNFSIKENGEVIVKTSKHNGNLTKTAELKDGIIELEPDYKITSEGENITFELLRFKYETQTYGLYMGTYWVEDATSETGLRLAFGNFSIGLIQE